MPTEAYAQSYLIFLIKAIVQALNIAVLNKMRYTPLATDALCPRRPMPYARESTSCY